MLEIEPPGFCCFHPFQPDIKMLSVSGQVSDRGNRTLTESLATEPPPQLLLFPGSSQTPWVWTYLEKGKECKS